MAPQAKGFIRGYKLLPTADIPSADVADMSFGGAGTGGSGGGGGGGGPGGGTGDGGGSSGGAGAEATAKLDAPLFDAGDVEMNAAMLMRFIAANCTQATLYPLNQALTLTLTPTTLMRFYRGQRHLGDPNPWP